MKRKRSERGAVVVEFAIVLPVLLLIILSLIDFGRYFYVRVSLSSASIEVSNAISRGLLLDSDSSAIKESKIISIINDVSPGIASFAQLESSAQLSLSPLPEVCPNANNASATTITTSFSSISPINIFFSTVTSTSTIRCLQ
ncbi:MAG: hypothetical protein EBX85_04495 [Actinobacteria bacterium]|nr:hypothetical protein [Actinomycetota bacterium]